jgi:hypothetical protein
MAEQNYRKLESKTRRQHYTSILIRHLSGETPDQIAGALKMTLTSVERDLNWIRSNWSQRLSTNGKEPSHQAPDPEVAASWLANATCCNCSAKITAGEGRTVVTALEIVNRSDDGGDALYRKNGISVPGAAASVQDVRIPGRKLLYCCQECSTTVSEFKISNPAFGQLAQRVARETHNGAVEATRGKSIDDGSAVPDSGEAAQKVQLDKFLKEPRSRGIDPFMRTASRMWVDGASYSEIERKLGRERSYVTRKIKAARRLAFAPL